MSELRWAFYTPKLTHWRAADGRKVYEVKFSAEDPDEPQAWHEVKALVTTNKPTAFLRQLVAFPRTADDLIARCEETCN